MPVPLLAVNDFFHPIVGDPESTALFADYLRQEITSQAPEYTHMDPYSRLHAGGMLALWFAYKTMPNDTGQDQFNRLSLLANGETGVALTVSTLKSLGSLYMSNTTAPQHTSLVHDNVSTALRHTYSGACVNKYAGLINLFANSLGMSPRNPIVWASILASPLLALHDKPGMTPKGVSPLAFRPVVDKTGQLHITPRHRIMRSKSSGRQCPATESKVTTAEGQRSALMVFMKTIGKVAVQEIYPKYFTITE